MRLIDADALNKILHKIPVQSIENSDGQLYSLVRLATIFDDVKIMPTIEPEQRWIPVTERLPEERKVYLVTYVTPKGRRYVRDCETNYVGKTPAYVGWSKKINGDVVAWMPLPQPYREDTGEAVKGMIDTL